MLSCVRSCVRQQRRACDKCQEKIKKLSALGDCSIPRNYFLDFLTMKPHLWPVSKNSLNYSIQTLPYSQLQQTDKTSGWKQDNFQFPAAYTEQWSNPNTSEIPKHLVKLISEQPVSFRQKSCMQLMHVQHQTLYLISSYDLFLNTAKYSTTEILHACCKNQ